MFDSGDNIVHNGRGAVVALGPNITAILSDMAGETLFHTNFMQLFLSLY